MPKYNYSVIIPFRGSVQLLEKACASVPSRCDIQILVIDNSTEYVGPEVISAFGNSNIQYLTSSPVKGAGCARNVGLEHAEGKYLLFLDADDYFTPDAFEAFDAELDSGNDIVFFNAYSMKLKDGTDGKRHKYINHIVKDAVKTGEYDLLRYHYDNPVCKMILRELVSLHTITFQEVKVSNDMMFSLKTGHFANKIKVVDKIVYMITEGDDNSSLTKTRNKGNQFIRFAVALDHNDFVRSVGRPDMTYRIPSYIAHAFVDFGLLEGIRWLKYWMGRCIK